MGPRKDNIRLFWKEVLAGQKITNKTNQEPVQRANVVNVFPQPLNKTKECV